jgi:thymidylate synthase
MRDSIHLHANSQPPSFEALYSELCNGWLKAEPFDRGEVHAQKVTTPEMVTRELRDVILDIKVPNGIQTWQSITEANMPWAEDHFQERVSGKPLNPPPSEQYWPFAQAGNAAHKKGEKFSHTYPERFWPKHADYNPADHSGTEGGHIGIRFRYGDLRDLVDLMLKNPRTRQAYLPVWFPEDLTASVQGERVPCTLGYHFMLHPDGKIHMTYYMRSCDLVRFFRDDVYMAGRLLQWVTAELHFNGHRTVGVGGVRLVISNLHAFEGDLAFIKEKAQPFDKRHTYDFGALS